MDGVGKIHARIAKTLLVHVSCILFLLADNVEQAIQRLLSAVPSWQLCDLIDQLGSRGWAPDHRNEDSLSDQEECDKLQRHALIKRVLLEGFITHPSALPNVHSGTESRNNPYRTCVIDTQIDAFTAEHPSDMDGWKQHGVAWVDFANGSASTHWLQSHWWMLNATRKEEMDTINRVTRSLEDPSCVAHLHGQHAGLFAGSTDMITGSVQGVFVDFHGQLIGVGGARHVLYHDFLTQLHVDGAAIESMRWSGYISQILGRGLAPSSPSAKWPYVRWKSVLALADRIRRPEDLQCASNVRTCSLPTQVKLIDTMVLLRPTLVLVDRHFRNFYHFVTLGLSRIVAALPLLRGREHHILLHGERSTGSTRPIAGFAHIRGALEILGLDGLLEYHPCLLYFLSEAIVAAPSVNKETLQTSSTHTRIVAPMRVALTARVDSFKSDATLTLIDCISPNAAVNIRKQIFGGLREEVKNSFHVLVIDRKHAERQLSNFASVLQTTKEIVGSGSVRPVHCEELSMREQVLAFRRAWLVVGVEGACLVNILWMHPSSATIEMGLAVSPPHEVLPKNECGVTYASVVAAAVNVRYYSLLDLTQRFQSPRITIPEEPLRLLLQQIVTDRDLSLLQGPHVSSTVSSNRDSLVGPSVGYSLAGEAEWLEQLHAVCWCTVQHGHRLCSSSRKHARSQLSKAAASAAADRVKKAVLSDMIKIR